VLATSSTSMGSEQAVNEGILSSAKGPEKKASVDVDECDTIPPLRKSIYQMRNALQQKSISFPEQAPLYVALFCSLVAIMLSAGTHLSTRFVSLEEPFRVSPFFKDVEYIGLTTWELCSIKQDALDAILAGETIKNEIGQSELSSSTARTTADKPTNVTLQLSIDYLNEPDQDDVLAPGLFPYNDDDAFDSELPIDSWQCHQVHISSANAGDDNFWDIARVFFLLGTMMGLTSTGLLIALIVRRGQLAKRRWLRRRNVWDELRQRKRNAQNQSAVLQQPETCETILLASNLLMLETDSSGYRPISICFLLSYLMQNLTLLFFDSDICRNQVCSMSTGAHGLLAASVLWVVSGLLLLFMMKKVIRNERQVKQLKRRNLLNRSLGAREVASVRNNQPNDTDTELAQCLRQMTSASTIAIDISDKEHRKSIDADNASMNITMETEVSENEISICSESSDYNDEVHTGNKKKWLKHDMTWRNACLSDTTTICSSQ